MIRTTVDIFCKVCGTWMHCGMNITPTEARQIAQAAGWRASAKYGDLCPRCKDAKEQP